MANIAAKPTPPPLLDLPDNPFEDLLALVDSLGAVHSIYDLNKKKFTYVNSAYEKIWEMPLAEVLENPQRFIERIHPDDKETFLAGVQQGYHSRYPFQLEYRLLFLDGRTKYIRSRNYRVANRNKGSYHLASLAEEITQQKQLEREREQLTERLEAGFRAANLAWWELELPSGKVTFDERKAKMLGYSTGDFQTFQDFTDLLHPLDHDKAMTAMRDHLEGRAEIYEVDYRIQTKAGPYKWFRDTGKISKSKSQGGQTVIMGIVEDITERKEAERTLQESEQKLHQAQKLGRIGSYETDLTTGLWQGSREFCHIFGFDYGKVYSQQDFVNIVHPEDRPSVLAYFEWCLKEKIDFNYEYRTVNRRTGKVLHVKSTSKITYSPEGTPLRIFGTKQDITEQVEQKKQLHEAKLQAEAANHAKSEFLANMSHELRTPLNSIIGFTKLMARRHDPGLYQQRTQSILSSAEHLLALITDLLDLSKIEAGRISFDMSPCDLRSIAHESIDLVSSQAEEKKLQIRLTDESLSNGPLNIHADCKRIKQVILNLLSNAIKFSPEGSVVMVRLRQGARYNLVSVRDQGPGIPPSKRRWIFEQFTQIADEAQNTREGTGLGLAVSKRIMDAHEGSITVKNCPQRGSEFIMALKQGSSDNSSDSNPNESIFIKKTKTPTRGKT